MTRKGERTGDETVLGRAALVWPHPEHHELVQVETDNFFNTFVNSCEANALFPPFLKNKEKVALYFSRLRKRTVWLGWVLSL